ncbi:MAG: CPBP family intramembrane metalloprotease [Bryobacterales bacterium]|nr:CPBP family intramembrane metalloprotease [Bryobacterales bacterium]MBV9401559.1 CPBP family intramembrane metalloprotease [Bryobacterales bacterium]
MSETGQSAFWGYEDLGLFLGAIIPSGLLGAVLVRALHINSTAARTLFFQCLLYAILLGALYLLIAVRYRRPFWTSLGWSRPRIGLLACVVGGPILAIATSIVGASLKAPEVKDPIRGLITTRSSLIVVLLFIVVLGPIFEELVFRGFLYPLLAKSFGAAAGIAFTALPFALLHGAQNQWAWQQIAMIGIAGAVFGYARYKTGSTAASTMLHCGFNLVGAVAYAVEWQKGTV